MANLKPDGVQQFTSSDGAGVLVLAGALPRMRTFADVGAADGDTAWIRIDHTTADEFEICHATYAAGTLTRDAPLCSTTGFAVDFSPGDKIVCIIAPGERLLTLDDVGDAVLASATAAVDTFLFWDASAGALKSIARSELAKALQLDPLWVTKTANYTAVPGDFINPNTTAGGFTIELPVSPSPTDPSIWFSDRLGVWPTHAVIIDGNGNTFSDGGNPMTCADTATFEVYFASGHWQVR